MCTWINPIFTSKLIDYILNNLFLISYSSGLVSLIRLSIDILSEATILKPYSLIVLWAACSSEGESITATPVWTKEE